MANIIRELETLLKNLTGGRQIFEGDVLLFGERGWIFSHSNRLPFRSVVDEDYTADIRDHTILVDAGTVDIEIFLPPADRARGRVFVIKRTDSTANTITITPDGSETIDGNSSHTLSTQYESVIFQSDGNDWFIWNA